MVNPASNAAQVAEIDVLAANVHRLMRANGMSEAELARQSGIPQPTLHKILSGKTDDPRASTLKALASVFEISIDELLSEVETPRPPNLASNTQSLAIVSWSECINAVNFITNLTPTNWSNWIISEYVSPNAYGLLSKASMEPYFPKGTILVIDPDTVAEDGDKVVVLYPHTQEATLRQLSIDGPSKLLLPLNANSEPTSFEKNIKLLGVVMKSVFSFHS